MLRLKKQKSDKQGDRFDFHLSNLQATQVPKGWDKLAVSIVSTESGKISCKSSEATVWRGCCRWTDTLSESIWIDTNADQACHLLKVVVESTGSSSRSGCGVLGEATVNLGDYTNLETSCVGVSLALEKCCSHRTILQMKLECTSPNTKLRRRDMNNHNDITTTGSAVEVNADNLVYPMTSGSSISPDAHHHHPHPDPNEEEESISRESSLSAAASPYSLDSTESSFGRNSFSLHRNLNHLSNTSSSTSQDSPSATNNSKSCCPSTKHFHSQDLLYQKYVTGRRASSVEPEAEARVWDLTKKLAGGGVDDIDDDDVQNDESLRGEDTEALRCKLSASKAECADLRRQIQHQLEDSAAKEEGFHRFHKELEEQVKFLKESNSNLSLQLNKTQHSNIDLLSVLQEMEEAIEKQRMEDGDDRDKNNEIESLKHKVQHLERHCGDLTHQNLQLVFKLKEMETNDLNMKDVLHQQLSKQHSDQVAALDQELERCYRRETSAAAAVDLDGKLESQVREVQKEVSLEGERVKAASEEEIKAELETMITSVDDEKHELESEISSMELECNQRELEAHLCEIEQENLRLSERICGLEAQLRYLTNEKEASRCALHNSESRCSNLDHRVRELEGEVEQREKKANEIEKQVLEAKDECGYLRVAHQKMQATAETLMEECSSLEKSNLVLRRQKMELHQQCNLFEAELRQSRRSFDNLSEEIQVLSEKLVSLSQETNLKERALNAELDALIIETTTTLSSNRHLLQGFDIPLLREVVNLKVDESSEARLKDEVAELRQNQQVLMSDRERLLGLVEDLNSKERRTKTRMRNLEMQLKACEFNRKELLDDVRSLKVELLRSKVVERKLEEATFEKQRVEASLQVIKGDYESIKKEKALIAERMSRLEREVLKLEVCRNSKEVLEEKVLRLEGDLTAKEALYSEEAELKNELARVRRANNQLQRRLHQQEEQRARAIQEEQQQQQQQQQQRKNSSSSSYCSSASSCIVEEEEEADDNAAELLKKKIQLLEHQLAEALDTTNQMYKEQLKSSVSSDGSMEKELTELRENYFNMSLKYALVEAEREQLVMKLRSK